MEGLTNKVKLRVAFLSLVITFVAFGVLVLNRMEMVNQQSLEIEVNWIQSIVLVNSITRTTSDIRILTAEYILNNEVNDKIQLEREIKDHLKSIADWRVQYEPLIVSEKERNAYEKFSQLFDAHIVALQPVLEAGHQNQSEAAINLFEKETQPFFDLSAELIKLVEINHEDAKAGSQESRRILDISRNIIIVSIIAVLVFSLVALFVLERAISLPLEATKEIIKRLAMGDTTVIIPTQNKEEEVEQINQGISTIVVTLKRLTGDLQSMVSAVREGKLSVHIDVGHHQGEFANLVSGINELIETLKRPLLEVVEVMQHLSMGDLKGRIVGTYIGDLQVLKINVNDSLERLTKVMGETKQVADAALQGDFSKRIDLSGKEGFFKELSEGLNQVLDYNQQMIAELIRVFAAVSQGDLTQTVTKDYAGSLNTLKKDVNATVGKLTSVMGAIKQVADAALQGDFSQRITLADKEGFFKELSQSLNLILNYNQQMIDELMSVFAAVSQGDLTRTVTKEYAGTLKQLKADVNATVAKLTSVMGAIKQVADAALQGDFSQRITITDQYGFFKELSEGLNQILDSNQRMIEELMRVFAAMSQGDLTQTITKNYAGSLEQLKRDVGTTTAKLTIAMDTIRQASEEVSIAATQISQGNNSLSQRTEEQSASLQETSASMEQMTGTVQQNAEHAQQATQLAASARDRAQKGGEVVGMAIKAMSTINESSKKVADIVSVINDIAFQTNLLALNAAVEAARAGEQGRGFAVVATEVRNLAQRSAAAAKEIRVLIQDSVDKVGEGTRLVNQSGTTLEEIMLAVKKVSDIIGEIAAASQEQLAGIQQVNRVISQMDDMTQQNAALVEEAASASESMSQQAESLKNHVAFFKTNTIVIPVASKTSVHLKKEMIKRELPRYTKKNEDSKVGVHLTSQSENPKIEIHRPIKADADWKDF